MVKDMILMILNHLLSSHKILLTSKMTINLEQLSQISHLITSHVNGREKSKLNNQENTFSTLDQMMVLNYGSTETN
jgi:hypothetical protein